MKIYYAHSNQITNSPDHRNELKYLKEVFPKASIIDPRFDIPMNSPSKKYAEVAASCDLVIVTEFLNYIGKGVFTTLQTLLAMEVVLGKTQAPQLLLMRSEDTSYRFYRIEDIKLNDINDWAVRYGKVLRGKPVDLKEIGHEAIRRASTASREGR